MNTQLISLFIIIALLGLLLPTPDYVHGFSLTNIVSAIKIAVKSINLIKRGSSSTPVGIFPFGGHITHSERGCHIKYWVFLYNACAGFPCPPFTGVPIWIGGNTIEVGAPLSSPQGQIFTFPFISDVYNNHSEGRAGPWAIGLGFTPFPIDAINDALDGIPAIEIGVGRVYGFHLDCSDNNKNVILKIGTSP